MKAKFEKVVAGPGRLFAAFEYWSRTIGSSYHFHPELELTAILAGRGRRIIGDHIGTFDAGDLALIGSNLPHQYTSIPFDRKGEAGPGAVVLQFVPGVLGGALLDAAEGAQLRLLLQKAKRGLLFRQGGTGEIIERMRAVVKAQGMERFLGLLEILHLLSRTKPRRVLASTGYAPVLDGCNSSRVSRACQFIQKRYCEPVRQSDAAAEVSMSPSAFSRMFQTATGLTFTAFLTGVRLSEAGRQLIETDATVAEISNRCGFTNLSNFNRRFLIAKKMTPRDYRRRFATAA